MCDVGERDDGGAAGLEQPGIGAQRAPGVDEVLEDVGRDQAVEAPELGLQVVAACQLLDVGPHDAGAVPFRGGRVARVELDAHHLDPVQQRRQAAGGAAEVEHPPGGRRHPRRDLRPRRLVGKCALVGHRAAR